MLPCQSAQAKPVYLTEIVVSSGQEIARRLAEQGLSPEEVVLKYLLAEVRASARFGNTVDRKSRTSASNFSA